MTSMMTATAIRGITSTAVETPTRTIRMTNTTITAMMLEAKITTVITMSRKQIRETEEIDSLLT